MISALSSKEDSDRLIRDLMKKTKDLEKQMIGMKQAHADGATALQEALADRAAMAEQFGQLKNERDSMDTKYQNLKGKHGKLKEKAASLKGTIQEFETVLQSERAQFKELEEALEDHQSQARRRERQLSNDLVLVTQERDGYSEQLVSLRDKISLLSRELAEGEEGGRSKGNRIDDLEAQLKAAKQAAEASHVASVGRIAELEAAVVDANSELDRTKRTLKQDLARVAQERDGYKDQVETLRDKVSLLARDLADNQDNSVSQGGRIASLEEKLHTAEEELASHKIKLEQMDEAIQKSEDQSAEQQKRLQALQEELQEACDAHARAIKSWMNEKQILCQDRDGFKAQLDSLRDKVSALSRELAEGTDSHDEQSAQVSALRKQISRMEEEHAARVSELQARIDSTSQALQERTDELEATHAESQRQAAAWKSERAQLVSDRDGYKGQVETLRDKVSALARDLTDSSSSSDERMAELQAQLQTTTGLLEEAQHNVSELEKKVEAAQATMSQQNQERAQSLSQHSKDLAAAEAAHSEAVALCDAQRTDLCQERDTHSAQVLASEALVLQLRADFVSLRAESEDIVARLQEELMTLKYDASTQAEALENITCQLTAEQHAHTATSEELADLLGSSSQDRKAWKADRAMLMCERDGAISQVETLRDKISALSRDLATNQGDKCASSPQTASGSVQQGDVADVEHVMDASVQHEMLELRRELGAAQAALDAQMPMVEQLQSELLAVQAQSKDSLPVREEAQAAKQALHGATEQISHLQRELTDVRKELEATLSAAVPEHAQYGQHELMSLVNSVRDIVGTISQTLGQPEPPVVTRSNSGGSQVSVGDVMSSLNTACKVAMAAQHAWDVERRTLEDKALQAAATGAMKATSEANSEKIAMKEELLKLQGQIELLEQRETDLAAAQNRAKVQVAALSVELQSTASEVERASASAECIASAAAEVDKERKQSVQGLHDRLKSSEDTIERLSAQIRAEAESHAEQLAELERQTTSERKQSRLERAQLTHERDGFCGQVNMLRDKIVELSRELADLRRRSKSCSGSLAPFPTDLHETVPSNNLISATADTPAFGGKAEGQGDWDGARASGGGSGELGTQAGPQGEQAFTAWQGLNLSEHTESPNWNVP